MKSTPSVRRLETFEPYAPTACELRCAHARPIFVADTLSPRARRVSLVCGLIAAAIMIETLFYKFTGAPESRYIFQKMGTEPWWRWGQGFWELAASIGLLVPRWRWAGGVLTTGAMLAALLSHLTWLGISVLGDHGLLFGMALATFSCGVTVLWLHRAHIPGYVSLST